MVCCDSDAASNKRVAYIGTDNEAMPGEKSGKMIKECLPNGGKIMLFVGHSRFSECAGNVLGDQEGAGRFEH